ncbi:uncharacterized protein Z520_00467 [Fonsecaea multimorphosa CBS 102226]|uniref:Uncharacterized protein n=1 Tax=Fonsecaea multimorphosa CBS 102226 TaxID=1442371 RepID=A0A0D2HPL8_9EURO|nr:uncharacterized protein Z520_00467 [Fonsecaea multimorphosa CBS 102226]KIY03776.1 hypothetical protein Z520_00467 [Fonsecaea multimorphosa CBS 102226]OAL32469.1 hypothetical protein AYO22_00491 [Fonsecaea multimorphosa]
MTTRLKPDFDQNYHDLPCPAHIAFAVAVVRSKPPQSSIEEYLEELRQAIVTRSHEPSMTTLDFDAAMYWKSSYHKAETERLKVANELDRLRKERDSLLAGEEDQLSKRQSAVGKRKRETSAVSVRKAQPAAKQQKASLDLGNDDSELEIDSLNIPLTDRQSWLHGFISLRHSLRLSDPDQDILTNSIKAAAIPVTRLLRKRLRATRKTSAKQEDQSVKDLCVAFRNVYPSILKALECIKPLTGEDGEEYYPAHPDLVRAFQAFLGQLHKLALDEYTRQEQEVKSKRRGSAHTHESFALSSEPAVAEAKEIVRTLMKMIKVLDVANDAHCELLEGYLCTLLDHVGSSLSLLVFADLTGASKKGPGLLAPQGLLDVAHLDAKSATGTATIEGPYIIWILRKSVEFLLANTKHMSEKSQLIFTLQQSNSKEIAQGKSLRRRIEETLQNTLLRGVFGDDDDTFDNSLRREEEEEEDVDLTKLVEGIREKECSPEWFIGEVWAHLGWDILSGRRNV